MKRLSFAVYALAFLGFAVPQAHADVQLQDFAINVNGTVSDWNNTGDAIPYTLPGMDASLWNFDYLGTSANPFTGPGTGTLTYTYDPGVAGSYFVNFYFDHEVGVPLYNEYGKVNGSPAAGVSYKIASQPSGDLQFWDGTTESFVNTLNNTNNVPGTLDNFLLSCSGATCNGDVLMALGFAFTLGANQEAVITVNAATTDPGGFSLEQTHPVDANNGSAVDLYLNGCAT